MFRAKEGISLPNDEVLNSTDVLIWWGHMAHDRVSDEISQKVAQRVLNGMGMIVLHSGHFSKPFKALMGTSCDLKWRVADEQEIVWCVNPSNERLQQVQKLIVSKEEAGEIPDDTVLGVLSMFGNEDLAMVVSEAIAARK